MVEALGAEVVALDPAAIGRITIADLPPGETRPLTPDEIAQLRAS